MLFCCRCYMQNSEYLCTDLHYFISHDLYGSENINTRFSRNDLLTGLCYNLFTILGILKALGIKFKTLSFCAPWPRACCGSDPDHLPSCTDFPSPWHQAFLPHWPLRFSFLLRRTHALVAGAALARQRTSWNTLAPAHPSVVGIAIAVK